MKSDSTLSAARKHTKYQALNRIGFSKQWESLYAFILVERHLMQELGIYKLIRRARKKSSSLSFTLFATTFLKVSSYFSPH